MVFFSGEDFTIWTTKIHPGITGHRIDTKRGNPSREILGHFKNGSLRGISTCVCWFRVLLVHPRRLTARTWSHDRLDDDFPFPGVYSQVLCSSSRVYSECRCFFWWSWSVNSKGWVGIKFSDFWTHKVGPNWDGCQWGYTFPVNGLTNTWVSLGILLTLSYIGQKCSIIYYNDRLGAQLESCAKANNRILGWRTICKSPSSI